MKVLQVDEQVALWVDEYVDRLTHLAFTYVRDWAKAEDVVQEAFIKVYRSIEQLKDPDSPLPWLIRIVINECHTAQRKTWRERITSMIPHGMSYSAEETFLQMQESRDIHSTVLALRESYRVPIYLFYIEGLSTQEISSVLDISPGAVRVRLTRGREMLSQLLKRGDDNEYGRNTPTGKSAVQNTYRG